MVLLLLGSITFFQRGKTGKKKRVGDILIYTIIELAHNITGQKEKFGKNKPTHLLSTLNNFFFVWVYVLFCFFVFSLHFILLLFPEEIYPELFSGRFRECLYGI